jgi:hypothetical protein
MSSFAEEVTTWSDLFTLAGGASATIIGLLFVAISLRTDIRKASDTSLDRTVVGHNFFMLLAVLLISIFFLVPEQTQNSLGVSVLITAAIPGYFFLRDLIRCRHDPAMDRSTLLWSFVMPITCFVVTMGIGIAFIINDDSEISWFIFVVSMLLIIPTRSSWDVLMASSEES